MNRHYYAGALFAAGLAFVVPAMATPPGWYVQGEIGFSRVNDADTSNVVPGPAPDLDGLTLEYDDGLTFGGAIGYARETGLRSELELRNSSNDVTGIAPFNPEPDGSIYATALLANLWWDFTPDSNWHPYIGAGAGAANLEFGGVALDDTVFAYQAGLGLEVDLGDTVALGLGYRYFGTGDSEFTKENITVTTEYAQHLALLTLRVAFTRPAPTDSDGDGVSDHIDKCPNTPKGTPVGATGCALDSDGDGVPDDLDQCPNTPAGVSVDTFGCALDSDGDGIPDYKDQCPGTPGGVPVDASGCSLVIDSDGDGVPDDIDQCPNTPPGQPVLTNGCAVNQGVILEGIEFQYDDATLTPGAEEIMLGVAETLKSSPGFEIEVAGHTDSMGSEGYNLALSQRRTESVVDFLVAQGVDRSRLNPVGYGESQPIAPNTNPDGSDNPQGRAQNRRVELNVIGRN